MAFKVAGNQVEPGTLIKVLHPCSSSNYSGGGGGSEKQSSSKFDYNHDMLCCQLFFKSKLIYNEINKF